MVRVVPIEPVPVSRVLGFTAGQGVIEADVKNAFAAEVEAIFGGGR